MDDPDLLPRHAARLLVEALADSPVVLIHGPRQCGKTTLARMVGETLGFRYLSFDDGVARAAAAADPAGFLDGLGGPVILDEVQHVPELFSALKAAIDRDRRPGRFLLTGSTNVLLLPRLADSLAGRMDILRLHPLSQAELARHEPGFLAALFGGGSGAGAGLAGAVGRRPSARLGAELPERVVAGGYPAALARPSQRRRSAWYRDYLQTLIDRDVRDLARIAALDALPRLLAAAAAQTAQLMNVADLAAPFQLTRPTIKDYLILLERVFLLETLPPWHSNRLSRLVKTPKLHLGDTGTASALLGLTPAGLADLLGPDRPLFGPLLETFVYQELRRQAEGREPPIRFFHCRDRDGLEVDLVLEQGPGALAGIEVKAAATVTQRDFRGLRKLASVTGERFRAGVVLYDGELAVGFGERLFALPIRLLWEL
jgi:uncharacterized protein